MDTSRKLDFSLVYQKTARQHNGQISLDGQMLKLLLAIDGKKNLATIGQEIGMNADTLTVAVAKLSDMGIIVPVQAAERYLDRAFLNAAKAHLAKALGPMAQLLIEDAAADLEVALDRIPIDRAAEFINALAVEIPDQGTRINFEKAMITILPK
jgi:hypothetical protein